ncbi:hypothetical protein CEXT_172061, partial [Caerostris extrusa]
SSLNSCGEAPEVLLKVEKVEVDSDEVASPVRGRPRKGRPPKLHKPAQEPSPLQARIKVACEKRQTQAEQQHADPAIQRQAGGAQEPPQVQAAQPLLPHRASRTLLLPRHPGAQRAPDAGGLRQTCIAHADLLRELLTWRLAVQEEAAPSFLYGAHHLLRLFVKLPDMITKQNLSRLKRQSLQHILENLLTYLVEKQDVLFPTSAYVDSNDFAAVQ